MADRLPSRPPRTNWGNLSKNLALWLLVGLLALALFQMMSRQRNPTQEFSYTEFSRQLDQGNVARVEVYDVVSETRRKWDIVVKDTRLSFRVRVDQ